MAPQEQNGFEGTRHGPAVHLTSMGAIVRATSSEGQDLARRNLTQQFSVTLSDLGT
jgi:hypothetical protein